MISILLIILLIIILLFVEYYINDGDLLSPPCLACIAFLVSSVAALYLCGRWDISIKVSTVLIIISGLAVFLIGSNSWSYIRKGYKNNVRLYADSEILDEIVINTKALILVCVLGCIISLIYSKELLKIANYSGDLTSAMLTYRNKTAYGNAEDIAIPNWINYSFRLFMAFSYAYTFIFINNWITVKKHQWGCLFPGLVYCLASLTQAARGQIIIYLFASLMCLWIVKQKTTAGIFRISFFIIPIACIILVVVGVLFLATGNVIGRTTIKTPFDSLMTYTGGSLIGFDLYLADPSAATSPSGIFGSETFRGLYAYFGKAFGIDSWQYTFQMEYRFINGINVGNLYTAFRYYIHDFGFIGMILLTSVQGVFFKSMYHLCIKKNGKLNLTLSIVYGYLSISIVYLPLADFFFHQYVNPTGLLTLFCFVVASWVTDPPEYLMNFIFGRRETQYY